MKISYSEEELIHLLHAWAVISFAFTVYLAGGIQGLGKNFIGNFIFSGITVGTAFILHELAHKIVAQKYGCWAEFRKFDLGLTMAVLMSFFGVIIAAPGAVMISGLISRRENGIISVAGPITNIILAILFLISHYLLLYFVGLEAISPILLKIIYFGFYINSWLAFFNMIPIPPLDGSKVLTWSFPVWIFITLLSAFMVFYL
jgi:Zn-dependent protease